MKTFEEKTIEAFREYFGTNIWKEIKGRTGLKGINVGGGWVSANKDVEAFLIDTIRECQQATQEEIYKFEQKVNQYYISQDAIDDDNDMLRRLIIDCRGFIQSLKEGGKK